MEFLVNNCTFDVKDTYLRKGLRNKHKGLIETDAMLK